MESLENRQLLSLNPIGAAPVDLDDDSGAFVTDDVLSVDTTGSNDVSFGLLADSELDAPGNFEAAAAVGGGITLTWSTVDNADYYNIWKWENSNWSLLDRVYDGTTFTDTEGTVSDIYATRAFNTTDMSEMAMVALAEPDDPTNFKAEAVAGDGGVKLTWDGVDNALYYTTWKWENNNWSLLGRVYSGTTITDTEGTASDVYAIRAFNPAGMSELITASITEVVEPQPPSTFTAAAAVGSGVALTWDSVDNADYYNVWKWVNNDWTLLDRVYSGTTFTDTAGTATDIYGLRAFNTAGMSEMIMTSITEVVAPAAPADFEAEKVTGGGIKLTWGTVSNADYYNVWKWVDNDWTLLNRVTGGTITDTAGTERDIYAIRAFNTAGMSDMVTVALVKPDDPTNFTAVIVPEGVKLTWDTVDNAFHYNIWQWMNNDWVLITRSFTDTFIDSSATATDIFAIRAFNPVGMSDLITASVTPVVAPATPADFAAQEVTDGIKLTWAGVDNADYYRVWKWVDNDWKPLDRIYDGVTYTDTEGTVNDLYGLRAFNSVGMSDMVEVTLFIETPVLEGELDSVTGYVNLSWDALNGATRYEVWRAAGTASPAKHADVAGGTTQYSDIAPTQDTFLTYTVRAYFADGRYSESDAVQFLMIDAPVATVAYEDGVGVKVAWETVAGATNYDVLYMQKGGTDWLTVAEGLGSNVTSFNHNVGSDLLAKELVYIVRAYIVDDAYLGDEITESAPTDPVITIGKPEIESAVLVGDDVVVTWDSVSGATQYDVFFKKGESGEWEKANKTSITSPTSFTHEDIEVGATYYYMVTAYGVGGTLSVDSDVSKVMAFTLTAELSSDTSYVDLSWTAIPEATSYVIARKVGSGTWAETYKTTSDGTVTTIQDRGAGDTGLESNTLFYYTVTAKFADASDVTSEVVMVWNMAQPEVTDVTYTDGTGVKVEWDIVAGADAFEILYQQKGAFSWATVDTITGSAAIGANSFTHENVLTGKELVYKVRAYVGGISGDYLESDPSDSVVTLTEPVIATASYASGNVTLTWAAIPEANVTYKVYCNGAVVNGSESGTDTQTFTHANSTAGEAVYTVQAYVDGASIDSAPKTVLVLSTPATPTCTYVSGTGVTLNWTAVPETGATYQVWSNGAPLSGVLTGTSFVHGESAPGEKVTYTVRAYAGTKFIESDPVTVTTITKPVLKTSTYDSDTGVTLTWDAVPEAGVTYQVWSNNAQVIGTLTGTDTQTFVIETPPVGEVTYTVRAYVGTITGNDEVDVFAESASETVTTLTEPVVKGVYSNAAGVTLTWDAIAEDTGSNVTYNVYLVGSETEINTTPISATGGTCTFNIPVTDLTANRSFFVRAYVGTAYSESDPVTVAEITNPVISSIVFDAVTGVTITWNAITEDTDVTYKVYCDGTPIDFSGTAVSGVYTFTQASPPAGKPSYFVRAVADADETGDTYADSVARTVVTSLTAPVVTGNYDGTNVTLTWDPVAEEGDDAAVTYTVQDGAGNTIVGPTPAKNAEGKYTFSPTTPPAAGQTLTYKVVASVGAVEATSTAVTVVTVASLTAPVVTGNYDGTDVELTWTVIAEESTDVAVTYKVVDGAGNAVAGADPVKTGNIYTFSPTSAAAGKTLFYKVEATVAGTTLEASSETVTVVTLTSITAPVVTGSYDTTNGVVLTWTAIAEETTDVKVTYSVVDGDGNAVAGADPVKNEGTYTFSPTSAVAGKTLTYKVVATAFDDETLTATSTAVTVVTVASLTAPVVTGNYDGTDVELTWTAIAEESTDVAVTYKVVDGAGNAVAGAAPVKTGNIYTFSPTSAAAGKTLTYKVVATADDDSTLTVDSNVVTVVTVTALTAPVVTGNYDGTDVTLTWTAIAEETTDVAVTYKVVDGEGNAIAGADPVKTGNIYTFSPTSAAAGKTLTYKVVATATDDSTLTVDSNVVTVVTLTTLTKPSMTASYTYNAITGGVTLSWAPIAEDTDDVEVTYTVLVGTDTVVDGSYAAGVFTFTTPPAAGQTLTYKVKATVTGTTLEAISDPKTVTTLTAPAGTGTYLSGEGVELTWAAIAEDDDTNVTYTVYRGETLLGTATGNVATGYTYTDTAPPVNEASVVYTIRATVGTGESAVSIDSDDIDVPTTGDMTVTVAWNDTDTATVSWTGVDGADSYKVYRRIHGETGYTLIDPSNGANSYTDTDPTLADTVVYYAVQAFGTVEGTPDVLLGSGDYVLSTLVEPVGAATYNGGSETVTVTWAATGAEDFELLYSNDGGTNWQTVGNFTRSSDEYNSVGDAFSCDITGVADTTNLQYKIVASLDGHEIESTAFTP